MMKGEDASAMLLACVVWSGVGRIVLYCILSYRIASLSPDALIPMPTAIYHVLRRGLLQLPAAYFEVGITFLSEPLIPDSHFFH